MGLIRWDFIFMVSLDLLAQNGRKSHFQNLIGTKIRITGQPRNLIRQTPNRLEVLLEQYVEPKGQLLQLGFQIFHRTPVDSTINVTMIVRKIALGMIASINVIKNLWDQIGPTGKPLTCLGKEHTMRQKESIIVGNAINSILTIIARSTLAIFGFVNLLGILWYWGDSNVANFVRGVIFSISALYIGFSRIKNSRSNGSRYSYYAICILGSMASAWLCVGYSIQNYRSIFDIFEQVIIILCFLFMLVSKLREINRSK